MDEAISLPTVIFTVTTIVLFAVWLVARARAGGADAVDRDEDTATPSRLEVAESDVAAPVRRGLEFLGVTGVSVPAGLTLLSGCSWVVSMIFMAAVGDVSGSTAVIVGVLGFGGSVLLGGFLAGSVTRLVSPLGRRTPPESSDS